MTDFLKFINTADSEELRKLPGIGATLAKSIVSARPFSTDDEVLTVKGLDEKLLVKLQAAYFERFQATQEMGGAATGPSHTPIVETDPAMASRGDRGSGPGFWSRLGKAFTNLIRAFLWLVLVSAILAGIGAGIYFGIPYLYERYVRPVEVNALQISRIATQQAADLATTRGEVADLGGRLDSLEGRAGAVETTIAEHTTALGQLDQTQARLESALGTQRTDLLADLDYQVKLTRAIELLSRGRQYLSQSNFGLARDDVLSAREVLAGVQGAAPTDQVDSLTAVIARLDLTLGNLPGYPVIAAYDLEIAWQVLIDGLPAGAEALVTPMRVFPTLEPTGTPSPLPPPAPTTVPFESPTPVG
jgi:hypothetical protein